MKYYLPKRLLSQIESQAQSGFPYEICGFIGGAQLGYAQEIRPARNVATNRQVEYNIAPEETLAALLDFELRGLKITAVYHSHPRYPAHPSEVDLALADLPNAFYLITSVTEGLGRTLRCKTRAWILQNGEAIAVELILTDS